MLELVLTLVIRTHKRTVPRTLLMDVLPTRPRVRSVTVSDASPRNVQGMCIHLYYPSCYRVPNHSTFILSTLLSHGHGHCPSSLHCPHFIILHLPYPLNRIVTGAGDGADCR